MGTVMLAAFGFLDERGPESSTDSLERKNIGHLVRQTSRFLLGCFYSRSVVEASERSLALCFASAIEC